MANYSRFKENQLDTQHFPVIIQGEFNTPGFTWTAFSLTQTLTITKISWEMRSIATRVFLTSDSS